MAAEAVRRAKKLRFNRALWKAEATVQLAERSKAGRGFCRFPERACVTTEMENSAICGSGVSTLMTIRPSSMPHRASCRDLPDRGLIIDIRDNPGGLIWAAERLLQIFTPNTVQPTKFALRATAPPRKWREPFSTARNSAPGRSR